MKYIDLNSDVGEGFGCYKSFEVEELYKVITSANIACGYHARDPAIMEETIRICLENNVGIGAIQVPGDGVPIILMNDCGTTGGYPKIGTVVQSDIFKIAQLKAGDKIKFKPIEIREAIKKYRQYHNFINEIKEELTNKVDNNKYYNVTINGQFYSVIVQELL